MHKPKRKLTNRINKNNNEQKWTGNCFLPDSEVVPKGRFLDKNMCNI